MAEKLRPVGQPEELHLGGREDIVRACVVVQRQPDLFLVVDALNPPRRLAGRLDGGQEQRDQDGDDGDHHQRARSV